MNAAEFHAAWPKDLQDMACKENWTLGLRGDGGVRLLYGPKGIWPDAEEVRYNLVYSQQPHHAAARELLKGSPEWPRIVRDALERRVSEGL